MPVTKSLLNRAIGSTVSGGKVTASLRPGANLSRKEQFHVGQHLAGMEGDAFGSHRALGEKLRENALMLGEAGHTSLLGRAVQKTGSHTPQSQVLYASPGSPGGHLAGGGTRAPTSSELAQARMREATGGSGDFGARTVAAGGREGGTSRGGFSTELVPYSEPGTSTALVPYGHKFEGPAATAVTPEAVAGATPTPGAPAVAANTSVSGLGGAHPVAIAAGMAAVGGVTSYATGGNFMQGAVMGGVGGYAGVKGAMYGAKYASKNLGEGMGRDAARTTRAFFLGSKSFGGRSQGIANQRGAMLAGAGLSGMMFGGNRRSHKRGFNSRRGNGF